MFRRSQNRRSTALPPPEWQQVAAGGSNPVAVTVAAGGSNHTNPQVRAPIDRVAVAVAVDGRGYCHRGTLPRRGRALGEPGSGSPTPRRRGTIERMFTATTRIAIGALTATAIAITVGALALAPSNADPATIAATTTTTTTAPPATTSTTTGPTTTTAPPTATATPELDRQAVTADPAPDTSTIAATAQAPAAPVAPAPAAPAPAPAPTAAPAPTTTTTTAPPVDWRAVAECLGWTYGDGNLPLWQTVGGTGTPSQATPDERNRIAQAAVDQGYAGACTP